MVFLNEDLSIHLADVGSEYEQGEAESGNQRENVGLQLRAGQEDVVERFPGGGAAGRIEDDTDLRGRIIWAVDRMMRNVIRDSARWVTRMDPLHMLAIQVVLHECVIGITQLRVTLQSRLEAMKLAKGGAVRLAKVSFHHG